jgi:predicted Rossmann fold nucleotide-binding protein DprA/Smf involved in DNA uptake
MIFCVCVFLLATKDTFLQMQRNFILSEWSMKNNMKENLNDLIKEMIAVDYCADDLIKAGQDWLESNGDSSARKLAATNLITELEQCIVPIDDAIALAKSYPDEDFWKGVLEAELKAKDEGMTICGCVACNNKQKVFDNKELLFNTTV